MLGIGEQWKRDSVLGGELRLALLVEDADAEDDGLLLAARGQARFEVARFLRAAGRVVLRVEVEDDRLARIVRETMRFTGLIFERERGRLLTGIDQRHSRDLLFELRSQKCERHHSML